MFLREVEVENQRALHLARLSLESTTALIGENDCGSTSLLDALELVLGDGNGAGARVSAHDFYREPGAAEPSGPLRIALTFEERAAGEWSAPEHAPVQRALPPAGRALRRIALEARAEPPPSGEPHAKLELSIRGVADRAAGRALVDHVRRTSPLLRVSGSALTGHGWRGDERTSADLAAARLEPEVARQVGSILSAADDLIHRRSLDPAAALESGFVAARELLARRPRHIDPGSGGLARSVVEILGDSGAAGLGARGTAALDSGTVAERLGVLLLVAAILRRMPAGLGPGCEPIWVVEDPEAHLHPMTLASVARLLERVRWQKLLTTQSGDLLSRLPLSQIRRLIRHAGRLYARGVRPKSLSREDLRRVAHHLRARRGVAMFARVWLLVEGESEFWILPQLARVLGHDLDLAGVCCLEYAQCGLEPLLRTAREFGIEWHLLTDGDQAGRGYAAAARRFVRPGEERERVTVLREWDIEHCLWQHGHAALLRRLAALPPGAERSVAPRRAIAKAVKRHSKPGVALAVVEAAAQRGPRAVPAPIAEVVETCISLSRRAAERVATAERDSARVARAARRASDGQ